ncbi:hypothetical protein M3Y95_00830000 [Aphelenchoides besseyi]|nr:hypothetical protein M3Y95_00830000 [Aphelenchoides besseyi]
MDRINELVKWIQENGTAQDIADTERLLEQLRQRTEESAAQQHFHSLLIQQTTAALQQQWMLAVYNQLQLNSTLLTPPSTNWLTFPSPILPTSIQQPTSLAFGYSPINTNWSSQAFQTPTTSSRLPSNSYETPDSAYVSINRTLDQTSPVAKRRNISAPEVLNQTPTTSRLSTDADKPYECPTCHKRFSRKFYMENGHRRIHTNEKPYACHKCHKQFSDPSNCRAHEQICRPSSSTE